MKTGASLINASRGHVVDIEALIGALDSRRLKGAAIDVFPKEPKSNADTFVSPLRGRDNVILTPHLAGSPRTNGLRDIEQMITGLAQALFD